MTGLLLVGLLFIAAPPVQAASPWEVLDQVRQDLRGAGPTAARFTQEYLPAGMSTGERETGHLGLEVPNCLRWDYDPPDEKSFLLCGEQVHAWIPDDPVGQRYRVVPQNEPGLDLLLLLTEDLRLRYNAESLDGEGETTAIRLRPVSDSAVLREATLTVDRQANRLVRLEYLDGEGNRTRFDISGYEKLEDATTFTPPEGIEWREP